jgi:thiamine-monophosphate kinase
LGNAGLGLKIKQGYACNEPELALNRFNQPQPRIAEGLALRGLANACIDISDGLAADLRHILQQSQVGACLDWQQLPLSAQVLDYIGQTGDWRMPLIAGDDYELCFTVPTEFVPKLPADCQCVGVIEAEPGLRVNRAGMIKVFEAKGFEHFS